MNMRISRRLPLFVIFFVGLFLGCFQIFRFLEERSKPVVVESKKQNALERDLSQVFNKETREDAFLENALRSPEEVLLPVSSTELVFVPEEVRTSEKPGEPLTRPVEGDIGGPVVNSATSTEIVEGPAVAGSKRMRASFDSLRSSEVTDPNSKSNQAMLKRMEAMLASHENRPPSRPRSDAQSQ